MCVTNVNTRFPETCDSMIVLECVSKSFDSCVTYYSLERGKLCHTSRGRSFQIYQNKLESCNSRRDESWSKLGKKILGKNILPCNNCSSRKGSSKSVFSLIKCLQCHTIYLISDLSYPLFTGNHEIISWFGSLINSCDTTIDWRGIGCASWLWHNLDQKT